jgi:hypothetical protein
VFDLAAESEHADSKRPDTSATSPMTWASPDVTNESSRKCDKALAYLFSHYSIRALRRARDGQVYFGRVPFHTARVNLKRSRYSPTPRCQRVSYPTYAVKGCGISCERDGQTHLIERRLGHEI